MKKTNRDIRITNTDFEVRSDEENKTTIVGYALKFDSPSEDLGFTEYIDRSALDEANMDNVVGLLNHDPNLVLARSGRNMDLTVDEVGLRFEIKPTETSYTKDLLENMRNGLIDKCSFAFRLDYTDEDAETWSEEADGRYVRTIHKIERLFDVSVVTTPAYEDTVALLSTRSKSALEDVKQDINTLRSREIELLDMELDL